MEQSAAVLHSRDYEFAATFQSCTASSASRLTCVGLRENSEVMVVMRGPAGLTLRSSVCSLQYLGTVPGL